MRWQKRRKKSPSTGAADGRTLFYKKVRSEFQLVSIGFTVLQFSVNFVLYLIDGVDYGEPETVFFQRRNADDGGS